jgi:hypothetical protein
VADRPEQWRRDSSIGDGASAGHTRARSNDQEELMSNSTQGLAVLVFLAGATVVGIGGLEGSLLLALVGIAGIAASVPLFLKAKAVSAE